MRDDRGQFWEVFNISGGNIICEIVSSFDNLRSVFFIQNLKHKSPLSNLGKTSSTYFRRKYHLRNRFII